MNNHTALANLSDCSAELQKIQQGIDFFGQSHSMVPFLTNYAVIKCCGTIEYCFKIIISDFHNTLPIQAKNYIETTFLNSSMNPSKENICKSLRQFDDQWFIDFKAKLANESNKSRMDSSLSSLNQARNSFAHGTNPAVSFASVITYYNDAKRIIEILDEVVR